MSLSLFFKIVLEKVVNVKTFTIPHSIILAHLHIVWPFVHVRLCLCREPCKCSYIGYLIYIAYVVASWSSGRVQDWGLGSRSSPGFNTLPVRLLVVPLSKALHTAFLLSTQEEMGTCEGRFVSRGAKLRVSGCILPRELRWNPDGHMDSKGPVTREGTWQSLQSRALSLDVDSN